MVYFARQKRQSRFYWAELGFIALGLIGLQPSLFTNLITGSASKLQARSEALYQTQQSQAFRGYEYMPAPQFASYLPAYQTVANNPVYGGPQLASSLTPYSPYNVSQPFYNATQPYSTAQPYNTAQSYYGSVRPDVASTPLYSQPNYSQPNYSQPNYSLQGFSQPLLPSSNIASHTYTQQPLYNTPSTQFQQNDFQPARSRYSSGGQNSAVSSNNWSASQPSLYAGNTNSYVPPAGNASKQYQNYATSLHNATAPRLTQNQMFQNGVNANSYGSTSAQDYRNQPTAGYSSFPSNRVASPLYR